MWGNSLLKFWHYGPQFQALEAMFCLNWDIMKTFFCTFFYLKQCVTGGGGRGDFDNVQIKADFFLGIASLTNNNWKNTSRRNNAFPSRTDQIGENKNVYWRKKLHSLQYSILATRHWPSLPHSHWPLSGSHLATGHWSGWPPPLWHSALEEPRSAWNTLCKYGLVHMFNHREATCTKHTKIAKAEF